MNEHDIFKRDENDEDFKMCDLSSADLQVIFDENAKSSKNFKDKYIY